MKTDRAALLWGTIIGTVLVTLIMVFAFKFPNFQVPFRAAQGEAVAESVFFSFLFAASYRKLWKRAGFWTLLLVFGVVNWLIALHIAGQFGGIRMDLLYGIVGGGEFAILALIMVRLYRQGPEVPSWMRPPS